MNADRGATAAAPTWRTRTYTNAGMAVLCLVVFAMVAIARRDNRELRRHIDMLRDSQRHRTVTVHGSERSVGGGSAPVAAAPEPALAAAELEPALLRLSQGCAKRGVNHFRSDAWPSSTDIAALFARVAPKDLPRALAIINAFPPGDPRTELWRALFHHWATVDPAAAAAQASTLPPQEASAAQWIVADVWAWADPAAALAYFGPTENVFMAYAEKFPAQAAQIATSDQRANSRGTEIDCVARAWFAKDPAAAWAWASTLPDRDRAGAVGVMLEGRARIDPQSVEAFVAGQPRRMLDELHPAIGSAAAELAEKDIAAARQWAMQLPAGTPAHDAALQGVVRTWAAEEPQAAARWIADLPEPDRTRAIGTFFFVPGNVEAGLVDALASRTSDARLRESILTSLRKGDRAIPPR